MNIARPTPGDFIFIGDGDSIPVPKKRAELWPSYEFSMERAMELQLQVAIDAGLESTPSKHHTV